MVRYRNPGTQVFEDSEHESVSAEEATVGQTGPVTGLFGDTGEAIPVMGGLFNSNQLNTTSTTYTRVASVFIPRIPTEYLSSLTGVADVAVGLSAKLQDNQDAGTVYLRAWHEGNSLPNTEVTAGATEDKQVFTGYEPISALNTASSLDVEMKADGGEALVTNVVWSVAVILQ